MPADLEPLIADLRAEMADLDAVLASVTDLDAPTPAAGWSVRDTVSHLAGSDEEALRALTDPEGFTAGLAGVASDPEAFLAGQVAAGRARGDGLLPWWREVRERLLAALAAADPAARVPWYGPAMSPASFVTARLMEHWAHGQDVADAAGVRRAPTERLRHIAFLGVRTRGFSYRVKGRPVPQGDVRVELTAPSGEIWAYGDPGAADRVRGSAEEFCLVITQRRHVDDTALEVTGPLATEWMRLAQAFAGLPSTTDEARRGLPVH